MSHIIESHNKVMYDNSGSLRGEGKTFFVVYVLHLFSFLQTSKPILYISVCWNMSTRGRSNTNI